MPRSSPRNSPSARHESVVESLMTIRLRPEATHASGPFLDGVQAVLFTSANGVRAFAAATTRRGFRAFAVGDATAAAARAAGFADVDKRRRRGR